MAQVTLPFAVGDIVGIRFMVIAGVVDEIRVNQYGITYFLNTCHTPHERIGSFDVHELSDLGDE